MISTTLNRIRAHGPCADGWDKLLAGLGKTRADDESLPYSQIARISGLEAALWATRCEPQHAGKWRLFTIGCVRRTRNLMTDPRSVTALDVGERHARGEATDDELAAARDAAWDAVADSTRKPARVRMADAAQELEHPHAYSDAWTHAAAQEVARAAAMAAGVGRAWTHGESALRAARHAARATARASAALLDAGWDVIA